jgi:hypothetical protein
MDLKSYNKALSELIKKGLDFSFIKEIDPTDDEIFYCNDTDAVKYQVIAKKDNFTLLFVVVDLENIWAFIEPYFRKVYYESKVIIS